MPPVHCSLLQQSPGALQLSPGKPHAGLAAHLPETQDPPQHGSLALLELGQVPPFGMQAAEGGEPAGAQ